ncbi:MAG: YscO family type III secretion system apparatus protein [Pseudomonadota bacterium]
MFAQLLGVKKLKQQSAAAAVSRAKSELLARREAVTAAEKEAEAYHAYRLTEEVNLFERIKGTTVKLEKIDEMKGAIAALREREETYRQEVEKAERAAAEAAKALKAAEAQSHQADKAVQKYEQLVENERVEAAKAAVVAEDAEIEEISEAIFAVRSGREA